MTASVVFGWLMTGHRFWLLAPVVGLDWFLINLVNRVTDLDEDLKNGIQGTGVVARHVRALTWASFVLMGGSLVALHFVWPALTPYRVAVHVIGLGYNYDLVPTPRGFSRFKEISFPVSFCLLALFLVVFFVPFELTYEILYDLRDLEGDRAEGIPTYPVVHGPERARQIIDGLLVLAVVSLVVGIGMRWLGVREALMLAAPASQLAFYRPRVKRGLTKDDCIWLTHLGTAELALYLVGTALWSAAGMPENIYL